MYEGVWNDDVAKCGTMKDFSRDSAPEPTQYAIPKVSYDTIDPDKEIL